MNPPEETLLNRIFVPILDPFFSTVDAIMSPIYMPWARVAALGLFVLTMIWVFSLNERYVNLDSPKRDIWHDLRLWTVLSMLPHIFVYLFL